MSKTFKTMDETYLGDNANEFDLELFQSFCVAVAELHPEMDDSEVTDFVWGDGDWHGSARKILGEERFNAITE